MSGPSIVYSCPHCGPDLPAGARRRARSGGDHRAEDIPSIDLRCLRCDASQTYKLVPDSVRAASASH